MERMSKNSKQRTALVVGLGSIGRRHIEVIKEIDPSIKVIVCRHKSLDPSGMGLDIKITNNLAEAISFSPDFAVICNPSPFHVETAIKLVNEDIHVLIEKPISSSSDDVQSLISLAASRNIKLMVGYNLRFMESLNFFKQKVDDSLVGQIFSVTAEVGQNLKSWRNGIDYENSVSARKELGGGVLLELSHEFDYLSWIFGEIDRVTGAVDKNSNLDINVEDSAKCIIGFSGKDFLASVNLDLFRLDPIRHCIVIGEKGTIKWNAIDNSVSLYSASNECWETIYREKHPRNGSYRKELSHFLDCIDHDKEPLISGSSALNTMHVIDAIRRSSSKAKTEFIKS